MKDCAAAATAYEAFIIKRQATYLLICPPPGSLSYTKLKGHPRSEECFASACPRLLVALILQTHDADQVQAKALAFRDLVTRSVKGASVSSMVSALNTQVRATSRWPMGPLLVSASWAR
jgi:hypothetical protein